jgi:hypothetical protein
MVGDRAERGVSYIQTKHDWSKAGHFNVSVTQNASHGGAGEKRAKTLAINAIAAHFFSGMHPRWPYNLVCSNIRFELIGGFDPARSPAKNPRSVAGAKLLMNETALGVASKPEILGKKKAEGIFANRITVYSCIVLIASLASLGYWARTRTIFACPADGYTADRYIAYCDAGNYADYEHGAFWFDLEPSARQFAKDADVLFLGNSRLQVAFSTAATADWFSRASARFYLLGFSYYENALFTEELLRKIRPRANVLIVNVDDFFDKSETDPVKSIWHDPQAQARYEWKRFWQKVHKSICKASSVLCGDHIATYRSRETGAYDMRTPRDISPVSYDERVDQSVVDADTAAAIDFVEHFSHGKCVILTMVPSSETKIGKAIAIAKGLGVKLVTPRLLEGLQTKDGYHLD